MAQHRERSHIFNGDGQTQELEIRIPFVPTEVFDQEIGEIGLGPDPFAELSRFLIRHFGRNKWNAYFQLLSLPIAVENVKPFTVLSQLKSLLPFGADVNSEMFMAMS